MKKLLFVVIAILALAVVTPLSAQTFYMDMSSFPSAFEVQKDSMSATDSSFITIVPPISCYYRGMTFISRSSAGNATLRFAQITNDVTAIDSCALTTSAIYANKPFTSSRAGVHVLLNAGTAYRMEFITAHGDAYLKPTALLWITLN